MRAIFTAILLTICASAHAYDTSTTRQNFDGSYSTNYSDGTSARTQQNFDGSATTRFNDGTTVQTRRNFDGSITNQYNN